MSTSTGNDPKTDHEASESEARNGKASDSDSEARNSEAGDDGPLARTLAETLDVFGGLTAEQFAAPSACDGWTVHATLAHLTVSVGGFSGLLPLTAYDKDQEFEAAVDAQTREVAARSPEELLEIFRSSVPAVLATFGALTEQLATVPVDMGTAGTYPLASIADAIVFDHTCHTRWDVLAPRGPIARKLPDVDAERLESANRWLAGAIPQMTTTRFSDLLTHSLTFELTGPGGTTFHVRPHAVSVETATGAPAGDEPARATVRTTAADFILWATGREPRHTYVDVRGDTSYAESVLDAFRVY